MFLNMDVKNGFNSSVELTNFSGPIFADPSRELYHALGMTIETLARTPKGQQKRSYLKASFLGRTVQSTWVNKRKDDWNAG